MLDPALTPARLRVVLERFHGFWSATEPLLDRWAADAPRLAGTLDWPRRRRGETVAADLRLLGATGAEITELPLAPPVFPAVRSAEALGWLYVSEGSTLGGAVIDRHLRSCAALTGIASTAGEPAILRSFAPYPEGPAPMWRGYLDVVHGWAADDLRAAAVLDAAAATFDALAAWLAPVMVRVAA